MNFYSSFSEITFWKIFSLRSKNSILSKRLIPHFVVPPSPTGEG